MKNNGKNEKYHSLLVIVLQRSEKINRKGSFARSTPINIPLINESITEERIAWNINAFTLPHC